MAYLGNDVREYRYKLLNELMDRENLDAVAFASTEFFQFATNFQTDVTTWERPILCVVPRNGAPFVVLNELSTNNWRYAHEDGRLWVSDTSFYAEHPVLSNRMHLVHEWPEMVAEKLRSAGLGRGRIGTDVGGGPLQKAFALLPEARPLIKTQEFRSLRWVKHPEEIALMREIAGLTDWLQDRYRENIRPGRLLMELDMMMGAEFAQEAARRFPAQDVALLDLWSISGPPSAAPHGDGKRSGATLEKGHVMINLIIPRINGVVVENERTWFCGKPDTLQERFFEVALAANEAGIEAAVAGRPVSGIDAAAQAIIEKAGFGSYIMHRTGHGMGLLCHEYPGDMAFNYRALLENEVYSVEPGLYVYGLGGFRQDDTVVIGEKPEVLTQSPKDLRSQTVL
ncbi:Xaa-Pro peptidase family protein (plasmid) [Rhizobium sp. CB3171]|uniref:M24 family metallopeptidase n=1 Tax=Rhizobium sp. CB3171 TaxID=3039157 RepID=UPI0024B2219C|nr:Xaa-Pro peptidase family protein [Rhizobium sp. CB3171]WFU06714.1 Xaa-Pro peptidase family protein [Rhizobium sp. CB3171]